MSRMYNPNQFTVVDNWNWISKLNSVMKGTDMDGMPVYDDPKAWVTGSDDTVTARTRSRSRTSRPAAARCCTRRSRPRARPRRDARRPDAAGARAAVPDHGDHACTRELDHSAECERRLILALVAINVRADRRRLVVIVPRDRRSSAGTRRAHRPGVRHRRQERQVVQHRGVSRARSARSDELGVDVEYIEPSEGNDRESALRSLAAQHVDLVIGVGFIFGPDLERLAAQFPDVKFAGIDYSPGPDSPTLPNLAGLRFREQEGAFLVGAIAGLTTHTQDGRLRRRDEDSADPQVRGRLRAPASITCARRAACCRRTPAPSRRRSPIRRSARSSAPRSTSRAPTSSSPRPARPATACSRRRAQRGLRAIGVDSDQYDMAPCCIVTSMIKRVDVAVVDIVKDVIAQRFTGGVHELGLAENGVGFVSDERNRHLLPLDVVQQVKQLGDQIIAGTIEVPSTMTVGDVGRRSTRATATRACSRRRRSTVAGRHRARAGRRERRGQEHARQDHRGHRPGRRRHARDRRRRESSSRRGIAARARARARRHRPAARRVRRHAQRRRERRARRRADGARPARSRADRRGARGARRRGSGSRSIRGRASTRCRSAPRSAPRS